MQLFRISNKFASHFNLKIRTPLLFVGRKEDKGIREEINARIESIYDDIRVRYKNHYNTVELQQPHLIDSPGCVGDFEAAEELLLLAHPYRT